MKCAWEELISILPNRIRTDVQRYASKDGQEIRLRLGEVPLIRCRSDVIRLPTVVNREELDFVINAASRYSPWAAETMAKGYLTAPGGHRIGICGEVIVINGIVKGFRSISSLNIRIARDFPGIAKPFAQESGNLLLIGPPGSGKTTMLRDLIRQYALKRTVCVLDERGEIFPERLRAGAMIDVISGCNKTEGIDLLLRTMSPQIIAVDEVTEEQDAKTLIRAFHCGVQFIASAHAVDRQDLISRPIYKAILDSGVIRRLLILGMDQRCREEQVIVCQ